MPTRHGKRWKENGKTENINEEEKGWGYEHRDKNRNKEGETHAWYWELVIKCMGRMAPA